MKRILWLMAWVGVVAVAGIWLAQRNPSAGVQGAPIMAVSPVGVVESNESPAQFDRVNPAQGKTPSAQVAPAQYE